MSKKVFNMQGGKHSAAAYTELEKWMYGSIVANAASFVVSAGTGMNLNISTGAGLISDTIARRIGTDAVETATVPTASASFNRIDTVVAYIDTGVTPTTAVTDNTNDILKFVVVAGTAASTPVAPTGAAIISAIGAGKPYMVLYDVLVPQNATNTSGMTFTDRRRLLIAPAIADGIVTTAKIVNASVTREKIDVTTLQAGQSASVKNASAKSMAVSETYYFPDTVTLVLPKATQVTVNVTCAMIISGDSEYLLYVRDQTLAANIWQYNPPAAATQGPRASMRTTTWSGMLAAGTHVLAMGVGTAGGAGGNISVGAISMAVSVGLPTAN